MTFPRLTILAGKSSWFSPLQKLQPKDAQNWSYLLFTVKILSQLYPAFASQRFACLNSISRLSAYLKVL